MADPPGAAAVLRDYTVHDSRPSSLQNNRTNDRPHDRPHAGDAQPLSDGLVASGAVAAVPLRRCPVSSPAELCAVALAHA